jgi:hypothetical protein
MRILLAALLLCTTAVHAASYGEAIPADAPPVSIAAAIAGPAATEATPRVFSGRVGKVCQKKGCWMMLTDGEAMVRVNTGYRYFLPTDASGDALVYGTLERKEIDAREAAHLARDAGEPAPATAQPTFEWRIDALAIRID